MTLRKGRKWESTAFDLNLIFLFLVHRALEGTVRGLRAPAPGRAPGRVTARPAWTAAAPQAPRPRATTTWWCAAWVWARARRRPPCRRPRAPVAPSRPPRWGLPSTATPGCTWSACCSRECLWVPRDHLGFCLGLFLIKNSYLIALFVFVSQDCEVVLSWLQDLHFEDYYHLFVSAGYDMPTISRMTPEVLWTLILF